MAPNATPPHAMGCPIVRNGLTTTGLARWIASRPAPPGINRYSVAEIARMPRPTGGAAAREALLIDPEAALAELIDMIVECKTLADWARRRGLAYTTAVRWLEADMQRAEQYELARRERLMHLANEVLRMADESTAVTRGQFRAEQRRMHQLMTFAERTEPGKLGRLFTERAAARARTPPGEDVSLAAPSPGIDDRTGEQTGERIRFSMQKPTVSS